MPGPLDGDKLAEKLKTGHVFVLPFSDESFGIACLEAMAWAALPTVFGNNFFWIERSLRPSPVRSSHQPDRAIKGH